MKEKEFNEKFIEKLIQLKAKIESDKMIYGNAFVHFTERGIEIIDPTKVELKVKNNKPDMKDWDNPKVGLKELEKASKGRKK